MFNLLKLTVLVLAALAGWYGYKLWQRQSSSRAREQVRRDQGRGKGDDRAPAVEATTQCRVCSTYVVSGAARHCGRADCPYPRRQGG